MTLNLEELKALAEADAKPPCDCCEKTRDGNWTYICCCSNGGDSESAAAWCSDQNSPFRTAITALVAEVGRLRALLERVNDEVYAPDPHCNCIKAPPCNDCVEYGGLRELLNDIRSALGGKHE